MYGGPAQYDPDPWVCLVDLVHAKRLLVGGAAHHEHYYVLRSPPIVGVLVAQRWVKVLA